jgi:hypothetical protein
MSKPNMTNDEMLKDLLLTFTEGLRVKLIETLDVVKNLELQIDKRFKKEIKKCRDGVGIRKRKSGLK